ncbi:hypothetical protein ACJU26_04120 [Acidithiobacillus sp. M4-SHS-6]|uniref:hypothetical protein n=1 Tax=Acidithiobacillus sp. M4-SHS-6 TaxID=3383024 RepID=UPI0039BDB7F2
MDVYKLRPEDAGSRRIEREDFEAQTLRDKPWYQKNGQGEDVQYAVCPACDNPIQIIGLYRLLERIHQPFGRHTGAAIRGLAELDPEERDNCPYFKPRPREKRARRKGLNPVSRKILGTLIEQFDRVVYLLRKQTGINFSQKLLRKMLETYRAERGYLYTGATLLNIPWVFAYMSDSQPIVGQYLRKDADADLMRAIRDMVPGVHISDGGQIGRKTKNFLSLAVCFIHHRESKDREDGRLVESMKMVVSMDADHWVHQKVIPFDHQEFQRLTHIPDEKARRQMDLVEMAKEVLGDLLL